VLNLRAGQNVAQAAFEARLINDDERAQLQRRDALTARVIAVDDFPQDFGLKRSQPTQ
jgi:hypothetical protein